MKDSCQLGITSDTLSSWQAHALDSQEARRISQHLASCAACQVRLDRFERIGQALRAPGLEPSTQAVWRALSGRILMHERGSMNRTQKFVTLSGLGVMAILVTLFVVFFTFFPKKPAVSVTPTATVTVVPTVPSMTPVATTNPLADWHPVKVMQYPTRIAFSTSSPLTGYVCGADGTIGDANSILSVRSTHDGGLSWNNPSILPEHNGECMVAVNPTDGNDVMVTEELCFWGCTGAPHPTYFRSRDGARTWQSVMMPAPTHATLAYAIPANSGALPGTILAFSWAGSTLYVVGISYATNNPFVLYRSDNGAPLVLVDLTSNPTSSGIMKTHQIGAELFTRENTLYLSLFGNCTVNCPFLTSRDNGATWQTITPTTTSPLEGVQTAADGTTLLSLIPASTNTQQPVRSFDGGRTWQTFPALPSGYSLQLASIVGSAPDGTLFLEATAGTQVTIFRLPPGANVWTSVYSNPLSSPAQSYPNIVAISATTSGHPQSIWGFLEGNDAGQITITLYQRPA